ncbi:MAG: ABC transporter permease [Lachnospiraceae bacterium]
MNKKLNFNLIIGYALVLAVLLLAVVGLFYTPYPPNDMDVLAKNQSPSLNHLFGTDNFGRDVFSRVMEGASTSFFIALCVVTVGAVFGTLVGLLTAYYGGIVDEVVMRLNDILAAFPSVLLAIVFVAVVGPGKYNLILALGITFIPSFARVVRSEVLVQKELDYVKNARLMGAKSLRILVFHILPNIKTALGTALLVGFQNAVLSEAGMSYLGLGVTQPDPSLGRMLSEAQSYLWFAPWYALAPGLTILALTLGIGLIGRREHA